MRKKNAAENSDDYAQARDDCAQVLKTAHKDYICELKLKIAALPRGSKKWWTLNRELLQRKGRISTIPPMRDGDTWLLDAPSKANVLAQTWQAKNVLPPMREDQYVPAPVHHMHDFVAIRTRTVERELATLNVNKATGPDRIGARILRVLASVLALPLAILCRRLLSEAVWPEAWKIHYLVPIFKRGVVHSPNNYRGVHLTNTMSKVVERVIGSPLVNFLQQHGYGSNQWAYRKKCSSRDLALMCMTSCVVAICSGHKMAGYLSDISGAFDRVCKDYMMSKLFSAGVPDVFLNFLNAYLSPRIGYATVEGVFSDVFDLCDMVFQGTVLGPVLWNTFFGDVEHAARSGGGTEAVFADDLNVFRKFDLAVSNDVIIEEMKSTRSEVHKWGERNRVTFDPSKEHIVIIHPVHGQGEVFRLLGTLIDVRLLMWQAVDEVLKRARPKVKALLRTRGIYSLADMLNQYKAHIWSYVEYHTGVLILTAPSNLQRIDDMQNAYLRELHISEECAFVDYNFGPASLRRDIGLLGFLHKRVLGQCHPAISAFLCMAAPCPPWHTKQIDDRREECASRRILYMRSIFGMILVYNRLPQEIVDIPSVSEFQSRLTKIARMRCSAGRHNWRHTFHTALAYSS